jgi:hypothetical protein
MALATAGFGRGRRFKYADGAAEISRAQGLEPPVCVARTFMLEVAFGSLVALPGRHLPYRNVRPHNDHEAFVDRTAEPLLNRNTLPVGITFFRFHDVSQDVVDSR